MFLHYLCDLGTEGVIFLNQGDVWCIQNCGRGGCRGGEFGLYREGVWVDNSIPKTYQTSR